MLQILKGKKITKVQIRKMFAVMAVIVVMFTLFTVSASAAAPPAAAGAGGNADTTYQTVIEFFITWLQRIGAMVALVGGIMFALAMKNNDAEQKQAGLLTLVAGFVVVAICAGANMFNLFG